MNVRQRTNVEAIGLAIALAFGLAGWIVGLAAPAYVLAGVDPNVCEQLDWRSVCPIDVVDVNDPNLVVLGPVPGDPSTWSVPAGWFRRLPASACDPDEGDRVTKIEVVSWSTVIEPKILFDPNAATWSIEALIAGGPNAIQVRAHDSNGGTRDVAIVIEGINHNPVLY